MRRLKDLTGLIPVEFPSTRLIDASPEQRAQDINSAFADPDIKAVLATIGGTDQITVIPHLDAQLIHDNPTIFIGYSDNTNLHNWLWRQGIASFYGGSTQVQLGAGPYVEAMHVDSLRAALITGGELELTNPGESEDFGVDWADPAALTDFGEREPAEPWTWIGPEKRYVGARGVAVSRCSPNWRSLIVCPVWRSCRIRFCFWNPVRKYLLTWNSL